MPPRPKQLPQTNIEHNKAVAASGIHEGNAYNGAHSKLFNGVPAPPPSFVPPLGASPMTWPNIYRNLKRIDYCVDQFNYVGNRLKCVKAFTGGPFLD